MSEHDEPKTALTRLLYVHRHLGRTQDGRTGCRGCDWTYIVAQSEAGKHFHAAHLADVLLAEGYTTSPAPDATETVEWGISVDGHDPDEDDIFTDETLARQRVAPTARERLLRREVTHWRPV